MSFFTDFSDSENELIISLPYRVGMWMSNADDIDGTMRDDNIEKKSLELVMKEIAKNAAKTPYISEVVNQSLHYRSRWEDLDDNDEKVLSDVTKAVSLIKSRMPEDYLLNYRKMLYKIAKVVAHAYNEDDGIGDDLGNELPMGGLISKVKDWLAASGKADRPENVSKAEAAALKRLGKALKI